MSEEVKTINKKVLILSWVSASWKSSIAEVLKKEYGFSQPIQFTTRKARTDTELDEYVFLNKPTYFTKLNNGDFANFQLYNNEFYAISKYFPEGNSVIIVDTIGKLQLEKFLKESGIETKSIYVEIDKPTMVERLTTLRRSTVEEIRRREKDFLYFNSTGYDYVVDGARHIDTVVSKVVEALTSFGFIPKP